MTYQDTTTRRIRTTTKRPTTTVDASTNEITTTTKKIQGRQKGRERQTEAPLGKTTVSTTLSPEKVDKLLDNLKKKNLTEQQKKDLETLAQLEREQAAILRQLSFLTNLVWILHYYTTIKHKIDNILFFRIFLRQNQASRQV